MNIKLPKLIETYLKASNESDLKNFILCFTDTATILDEGETLTGHEAISKWFNKTRSKYQFRAEAIKVEDRGENIILTAKVSGTFPNSPVTLSYHFKIKSSLIQDLRIG